MFEKKLGVLLFRCEKYKLCITKTCDLSVLTTQLQSLPHLLLQYMSGRLDKVDQNKAATHHSLSEGGGGMLMASLPTSDLTLTASCRGVLETFSMARLMYLYSVACWKYLDCVSLFRYLNSFLLVCPLEHFADISPISVFIQKVACLG